MFGLPHARLLITYGAMDGGKMTAYPGIIRKSARFFGSGMTWGKRGCNIAEAYWSEAG